MKNVLVLAKSLGGGGAEVALIELINTLPSDEYTIQLLLLEENDEFRHRLRKEVRIDYLAFQPSWVRYLARPSFIVAKLLKKLHINRWLPIQTFLARCVTNPLIFEKKYDVAIDFYGYGEMTAALLATRIQARKKAVWIHDEQLIDFANTLPYLSKLDKVVSVSYACQKQLLKNYPQLQDKAMVIYNAINTGAIEEKAESFFPKEFSGVQNFVTVGRLHKQKGYDVAIETAKLLRERGLSFHWFFIGMGPEADALNALVRENHLQEHIFLLGAKDNPYPYIKRCDLYIQPSRHEGYAISLVEARVLNKCIIASDIPSNSEQIKDGVNGYLVELSANKFADKIGELLDNPSKKEKVEVFLAQQEIDFTKELKKLEEI